VPIIKPTFDGSDSDSNRYSGPPPKPGTYHGVIKGVWAAKIKSGDNEGEPQVKVLVEIDQGQFKGAGLFINLQVLTSSAWSVNQWLDAMTDGSETQRKALRNLFWQKGMNAEDEADKVGQKVKTIGKNFKPVGREVQFVTKMDGTIDPPRAVIDRFVVPLEGGGAEEDSPPGEENEDALGEFDKETTSNPEPAKTKEPEEDSAPPPEGDDDDDDDPWS
jgi:hypothetical protein